MKTEKILICAPSWLGDMIMAHTLIRHLANQGHEIHVLASDWIFAVLARLPGVSECIQQPFGHGTFNLKGRYQLGKSLRSQKYDRAIVLQNSFKSALIPFFANIPVRTGWMRECRYGLLNDWRTLDKQKFPLMVQRYAALGYAKGEAWDTQSYLLPELKIDADVVASTRKKYAIETDKPVLALSPGAAGGNTKQWPPEYYAEIALDKIAQGWQVWLFGSPKDKAITDEVMAHTDNQCVNLAGRLKLFETVDLISSCAGLVGNDSGLLHVASALKVPVVGVYGATSPQFTPPLSDAARTVMLDNLECRPCFQQSCRFGHRHCLTELKPAQVKLAMLELGLLT